MSDLLVDQYSRLLDALPKADPWPELQASGFLDFMRPDGDGDQADAQSVFRLAFETGRRAGAPPVMETMAARLFTPDAIAVTDPEPTVGRPLAAAISSAQMAGAMSSILAMTCEYATTRKQFGREIGRFQAVQQQIAILAEEASAARMAAQIAFSGKLDEMSEARAGIAKLRCSQAARIVSGIAHAVHGAIGASEEHALHRFTRKLREGQLRNGGEAWWSSKLGGRVLADDRQIADLVRAF